MTHRAENFTDIFEENVVVRGTCTANKFVGDGSQITNLPKDIYFTDFTGTDAVNYYSNILGTPTKWIEISSDGIVSSKGTRYFQGNYTEDPAHTGSVYYNSGELYLASNGVTKTFNSLLISETDPAYSAWIASNPTSGTNTGDQDLSGYAELDEVLLLDQTTQQTTTGTFIFPEVRDKTNLLVGSDTPLGYYGIQPRLEVQFNPTDNGDTTNYSYPLQFINTDGYGGNFIFTSFSTNIATALAGDILIENNRGGMIFSPGVPSVGADITFSPMGWTNTPALTAKATTNAVLIGTTTDNGINIFQVNGSCSLDGGVIYTDGAGNITTGGNIDFATCSVSSAPGISTTIVTAQLTLMGSQGSMTFTNGILTAETPAT